MRSRHALPACLEHPLIGQDGPAANSVHTCAPEPPHSSFGATRPPSLRAGAPQRSALHAPSGGAGPDVKYRGVFLPNEDALQHLRLDLRAHAEQ
eukprot:7388436-Prymnesium_polylepis.2